MAISVKHNSLETRLIIVLMLLTALPAMVVGWMAYHPLFEHIRAERVGHVGIVANARHTQLTMVLARATERAELFLSDLSTQCNGHKTALNWSCAANLINAYLATEHALGANLYRKASSDNLAIGSPVTRNETELLFQPGQLAKFSGAGPINQRSYFIAAAEPASGLRLEISYPLSNLQHIFDRTPELGESGETFLVDGAGYFVTQARYPSKQGYTHPISAHPVQACLDKNNSEVISLDYRNVATVMGYRFVPEFGTACIMAHIDQDDAFAPLGALKKRLSVAVSIFLLLALLAAIYIAKKTANPIINLTRIARSITQGDYSVRADADGTREIAELSAAFNSMTHQLTAANAQLKQEILEREQFLKFFNLSLDPMCIASPDGFFKKINPAFARQLGYSAGELLARPFLEFIAPEDRQTTLGEIAKQLQGGMTLDFENRYQCRDGSYRWLSWMAFMNTDDGYLYGTARDITERKVMENALVKSEERTKLAIMASRSALWDYDVTTGRVYLSEGWSSYLSSGESPTYTTIQELAKLVPEEEQPMVRDAIIKAVKGLDNSVYHITHRVRKLDGSHLWVLSEGRVTERDQDGRALRMIGINRDITELKQAEEALWQQKRFMWQVIDTDPNLIFVKDTNGKYLMVNQALADFYHLPVREIVGKDLGEICKDSEECATYLDADHEVLEYGREVKFVISALRPDGLEHWYLTTKKPLIEDDGSIDVLGIAVDITELKLAEVKLAESYLELQRLSTHLENLREDERAKIARDLHDEMGSLLVALKMRVAWLASKLLAGMPLLADEAGHISSLLAEAISKMQQIVTQLRPNLKEGFGFTATIEDYVKKFRQQTGIECDLTLPGEELALDANQTVTLFRILQESLNNVAKYAKASQVKILFKKQDESLLMLVDDNGIGFDPAVRKEHAFGLIGIRERALMMGGKARIRSTPGKGTQVSVTLPCKLSGLS